MIEKDRIDWIGEIAFRNLERGLSLAASIEEATRIVDAILAGKGLSAAFEV